jgi:tetratricopeptide (TPR) repeat protein
MIHNIMGKNYQALQQYEEAERNFYIAHYRVPNRLYSLYLLAKLYIENGQTEQAIKMAQRIIDAMPKIISTATDEMKREMKEIITEQLNIIP